MKIIVIGTVAFSKEMLKILLKNNSKILGVVASNDTFIYSDYVDLKPLCEQNNIPCFITDDVNSKETLDWISSFHPDVIFCLGWSRLLKKAILSLPPLGVIGYHPSEIPKNRGRHPIIWSLVLGLKRTASSFFIMNENPDSGDIVSQTIIDINDDDDAKTLYDKLISVAKSQLIEITNNLDKLDSIKIPQNKSQTNFWRKRSKKDGEIDWRMSARSIHNLVRGLTAPYPGAHFYYQEKKYKVWKTKLVEDFSDMDIEPGKVMAITKSGKPIIKCGDGFLKLIQLDPLNLEKGDYL